ncbi:unnamed protein product, partial [Amoebophrya sp. A120]|eukprot:GSA120T00025358001.1
MREKLLRQLPSPCVFRSGPLQSWFPTMWCSICERTFIATAWSFHKREDCLNSRFYQLYNYGGWGALKPALVEAGGTLDGYKI